MPIRQFHLETFALVVYSLLGLRMQAMENQLKIPIRKKRHHRKDFFRSAVYVRAQHANQNATASLVPLGNLL